MAIGNSANSDRRHRVKATAAPIFYVSPSGSDSNDGLAVGTAFATLQKAIDVLSKIDCNGFDPEIRFSGTLDSYVPIRLKNLVGVASSAIIVGAITGASNNTLRSTSNIGNGNYANSVIVNESKTVWTFRNLTITHQWDDGQYPTYPKYIVNNGGSLIFDSCRFVGNGGSHDCFVGYEGGIWLFKNSKILSGSFRWVFDIGGASVNMREITLTANAAFTIYAKSYSSYFAAYNINLQGSSTGKRFELVSSSIDTVDFPLSFPGSITGTSVQF